MRGRNNNNNNNNGNRKAPNPLQRSYESNGPDVKVRGTAQHVAEKYLQLARDAQSSGDPVAAENYFQHAEHYYRILLAAQEQMAQQFGHSFPPNRAFGEEGEEDESEDEAAAFPQGSPQPDMRNQSQGGMNGHGANGGSRQDGEMGDGQPNDGRRFDRPNRNNDRFNNDRQNNDRNGNRRFDRQDRGERRFDRPEGQNGQPGGFVPRADQQAPLDQLDGAPAQEQDERRFERTDRPERAPRGERRPRRDSETDSDGDVAAALPSFLTNPVRVPIAVAEEQAPQVSEAAPVEPAASEEAPAAAPKRARRRRSPREVMDALGSESDNPAE
jgi:hypothetical protein